ncbi:MAG: MFS transporter [Acidobacteria bacterium]|nr:MFS transporter [Acidobacteriota bacterium]MBU1475365.1 MFS transporter [Acidobacteriota bacterium]
MNNQTPIHFLNVVRKFTVNSVFFLIPLHFLELGFSGWQIGLIMAVYASAPLLFSFPTGWINDRFTIQRVIQAGLILLILSLFLINWTHHYLAMAALFLLLGASNNALDISTNNFFYKDQAAMDQNRKYGLISFWLAVGLAFGTFTGGIITHFADFQTLFLAYTVLLLVVLLFLRTASEEIPEKVHIKEYRSGLLNRKTIRFALLIFMVTLHWGAEGTVYSPFLKSRFGLNNLQTSLYISIPLFFMASAAFAFRLFRHNLEHNRRLFLLAMAMSGTGLVLMTVQNLYVSIGFRILHEVGDGLIGASVGVYISRLFDRKSIGGSSGILTVFMTLGAMFGSLIFSTVGYRLGYHTAFIAAGVILLLNTVYGWFIFRRESY